MTHPWILLWTTIKQQGRTQKQFAVLAWKKVSEVNELIKGKRNITIPRDYVLHKVLWTEQGYRIKKQIEFDYQTFLASLPVAQPVAQPVEQSVEEPVQSEMQENDILPPTTDVVPPEEEPTPSQETPLPEQETSLPEQEITSPSPELLKEKEDIFRNF